MKRRWCKLKWKWKVNRANAEQFASQQKYRQQTEIDTVGVAAHGDPQTKRGIQKCMATKHEVQQTVVGCGHECRTDRHERKRGSRKIVQ